MAVAVPYPYSKRFDLCGGRVSGCCHERGAFYPPFAKGGARGDLRTVRCESGVLNLPHSPFVKGGGRGLQPPWAAHGFIGAFVALTQ